MIMLHHQQKLEEEGSKVLCETILKRLKLLMGKTMPNVNTTKSFLGGASKNGTKHLHAHMEKSIQKRLHDKGKGANISYS